MSQASPGRNCMVQGRIVWISGKTVFEPKVKLDQNTRQPRLDKQGQPMLEYGFGLAVPKEILGQTGPGQPGEIWAAIHAEAQTMYPNGQIPPSFAMKYKDGDGVDHEGKPFNMREGHAGYVIFAMTTSIAIKFFKWENGANVLIDSGIKCGDYVNVQVNIKAHPAFGQGKAGLYLNPNAVQFLGHGKEIINAPSGDQIFGNGMPPLPPGASATPLAPQPGQMLVPPGPSMHGSMQPPPQQWQQPQAPPVQPQPHYAVVPPVHQPPPGGIPMAQPQMGNGGAGMMPMAHPAYPAQPAIATHMGMQPGVQSFASPAGVPAMPQMPGYPQR